MKISVNDIELFSFSEVQKKVIANDIESEKLESDIKKRLKYVLINRYERCFDKLKKEWEPKFMAKGIESLPIDKDAFAALVFSDEDYKDKATRDEESGI